MANIKILTCVLMVIIVLTFMTSKLRNNISIFNNDKDQNIILNMLAACTLMYTLSLAFSISAYGEYSSLLYDINTTDLADIFLIYRMLISSENSKNATDAIISCIKIKINAFESIESNKWDDNLTYAYAKMNNEILRYIKNNPTNPFIDNILSRMTTGDKTKNILSKINYTLPFAFGTTIVSFIIIYALLSLVRITETNNQYLLDFGFITIYVIGIYALYNSAFPFDSLATKKNYEDILNQMQTLKNKNYENNLDQLLSLEYKNF